MTNNRTTELLPCPFCGGEAELHSTIPTYDSFYCCVCLDCGASTRFSTEAEAIAAWNTRAELGSTCPFARPTDLTDGCAALERIAELEAELGSGTLTAEQVMAIAGKHQQPNYCSDARVCFDWQAIADELNAELGGGTCEYVIEDNMNESEGMGDVWFRCTNCCTCYDYYADDWLLKMPHCPKCGAVVEGVR